MNDRRFISCGMYAPNDDVKNSWQALFDLFYPLAGLTAPYTEELVFDHSESVLRDPHLLIGHTCGYPLMTQLEGAVLPFCLPCFDLPGVDGKRYCSQFVVPADSDIESLRQCRGKTVAINNSNSNSGMNVLRYALTKIGARPGYFSQVEMTGGHYYSLEAVAANRAQLAAIDCVSYQLIADQNPQLVSKLRVIGYSEHSCGLPFVMPASRYTQQRGERYLGALNQALSRLPADAAKILHLDRFERVSLAEYQSIVDLENFAIEAGYPGLN